MHMCKMEYDLDQFGKQILVKDGCFQVMMEWEKPYMEACIDFLAPKGNVLEIGFGCGYSATRIQAYLPKTHTIIEYHPVVAKQARQWAESYHGIDIIEATWQDALGKLGKFDTIFFDDYPIETDVSQTSNDLIAQGHEVIKQVQEKYPFIYEIKYKDSDLEELIQNTKEKQKKYLPKFFQQLLSNKQISQRQYDLFMGENRVKQEILQPKRGDRFFMFLDSVIRNHLEIGGAISCYLEDPSSKKIDPLFIQHVITNPNLDYEEYLIDVEVPPNCKYYKFNQALVMKITKFSESK